MIKKQLMEDLTRVVQELNLDATDIVLYIPQNTTHGDYSSNIALQQSNLISEKDKQTPLEIANKIVEKLGNLDYLEKTEIAPPGFINFYIKDNILIKDLVNLPQEISLEEKQLSTRGAKKYLLEFAQPNTHKAFHIGHLRNISLGESLSRLLEFSGNEVYRATYGSDIGLPVAKAVWGVLKFSNDYETAKSGSLKDKADFLGKAYAKGVLGYESDNQVKVEIDQINKQIYNKDPQVAPIWQETRGWSIAYLEDIFNRLGTSFDRLFWESEVEQRGQQIVKENLGKVFKDSQGAIIFPGEKFGLHNRVFITALGNPTYEAKELGLAELEKEVSGYDEAWHIVANEQNDYFKVVFKALELINPDIAKGKRHISYGMVNLTTGKMSSRTGEVITAEWLFSQVKERVTQVMAESKLEAKDDVIEQVAWGAIKFSMLKYSPSVNISFDINKSVSLEGDSGPYIQYTHARCKSVLTKKPNWQVDLNQLEVSLSKEEREVVKLINQFPEKALTAALEVKSQSLAEYLVDLSRMYNLFYQKARILESEKETLRLLITQKMADVISKGLYLLGISAPDKM